jgi:DNA-binding PadR family transcriptional regulator
MGESMPGTCKMKGFLTFLVLWIVQKQGGCGQDIAREIGKRKKGEKPSPGTIYPVLKGLTEQGLIAQKDGCYRITAKGRKELESACSVFREIFYDMDEMCRCCKER